MSVVSRIDSYITNKIKLPWDNRESQEEIIFSVGQLEVYQVSQDGKFTPKKQTSFSFDSQSCCMAVVEDQSLLLVGLESGCISMFRYTDKETHMLKLIS